MLLEFIRQKRANSARSQKQALLQSMTALWDLHPQAAVFRARGGDEIPPPVACNLSLTNKCNLRCEICGSQKHLDATGILRRHMDLARFEAVAETLFPVIAEVELNSQGDPLLYPQIERVLEVIAAYRCELKVQTNGTLFTDRIIDLMTQQVGTINLSLDAVGPRFDEVRRGGVWTKAQPGLEKLLSRRDPEALSVGIYPTVTRRTVGDALAIVRWADEHDVDEVAFHRYIPIANSSEQTPTAEELCRISDQLREWAARHSNTMTILLDGHLLSPKWHCRRVRVAHPMKHKFRAEIAALIAPMEQKMTAADPSAICAAPDHYVDIGLEGQISVCCRAQDVPLGFATSPEEFAKAWFGNNYRAIRASLRRDATGLFPLPNCEGCVAEFAPKSLGGRRAASYGEQAEPGPHLNYSDWPEYVLYAIQKEVGHCYVAMTPPGMDLLAYQLFEDNVALGPEDSLHDDIRHSGLGQYSLWGRAVYFSTSDNSDARYNERSYVLKRREAC